MSFSPEVATRPRAQSHHPASPGSRLRCGVCHGSELIQDEVFDDGSMVLCECRRCEHRWTFRPPSVRTKRLPIPMAVARPIAPEIAGRRRFVGAA